MGTVAVSAPPPSIWPLMVVLVPPSECPKRDSEPKMLMVIDWLLLGAVTQPEQNVTAVSKIAMHAPQNK